MNQDEMDMDRNSEFSSNIKDLLEKGEEEEESKIIQTANYVRKLLLPMGMPLRAATSRPHQTTFETDQETTMDINDHIFEPFGTDHKIVIKYDKDEKRYDISHIDLQKLENHGIFNISEEMVRILNKDINLMPFRRPFSTCLAVCFRELSIIIILIYSFVVLYVIVFVLLNPVFLFLFIYLGYKIWGKLMDFEQASLINSRNKHFRGTMRKYKQIFARKKIFMDWSEMGYWVALYLEYKVQIKRRRRLTSISDRLDSGLFEMSLDLENVGLPQVIVEDFEQREEIIDNNSHML